MAFERSKFNQVAFFVPDIRAAIEHWIETTGVGPFFIVEHAELADVKYHGQPSTLDATFAVAQAGDVQIELIQQHCQSPSAYRDFATGTSAAAHHLCMVTDDFDAALTHYEKLECPAVSIGRLGGMRFAYFDTTEKLGVMIEVVERWEPLLEAFKVVAQAAENWDGKDPVRRLL